MAEGSSRSESGLSLLEHIRDSAESLLEYLETAEAGEILRRYFVMNAFDGALTMLGFIIGYFATGGRDVKAVLGAGTSACIAMGLSGFVGALITEKAEREREVRELEKAMFAELKGSLVDRAAKMAMLSAALVDALAPAFAAMVSASPLILALYGVIAAEVALAASIALTLCFIFSLGLYLGKISGGEAWKYGLCMLAAGLLLSVLSNTLGHLGW